MANGYIGKISALVTASTADLSRKLQGGTRDVNRFANSVQSQIAGASRAAQASLNGIFTPLQRIERALFAGRRLNLIDSSQVQQIQRAVSVAEGINKPLAAATRQFQGLSSEVQAQFLPALDLAQRRVAGLNDLLARSGNVSERAFGVTAERVERTAQAVQRLAQAQRAASAGFTGNELEFTNPRALEAINAAAAASQRAAALPASQRQDPAIAERVRQLQQFRNVVAQTVAEVEQIRLNPSVNTAALQAAEGRLDNIVETTRRAQRELDEIVNRGAAAQQRGQAASRFLQVDQRESQLTSLAGVATDRDASGRTIQERVAAINATNQRAEAEARLRSEQERRVAVANTLLQIDQRESQLQSFEGQATTRDASGRTIQERVAAINATNQRAEAEARLRAEQEARLAVANSLLQVDQRESDLLSQRGRSTDLGGRLAEQGRRRVLGRTGDVNIDATPPPGSGFGDNFSGQAQRDIDALGTRVGAVRQQLETLPNSIRTRFIPELQRAQAQLVRLQNSPLATVEAIDNATRRVERLEAAARRASAAFNFRQSFGGAGLRGIEEGLNQQALQGYTAQLQILQQALAGTSQAARGPAVVAFNNLRNAIADAMDRGTLETEQTRRVIRQLTQDAARAAAAAAGINPGALSRRLQRAGDIGRGAFGNLGLGIQQAIFAFDDFFSVTGGLDQRIRAAGNNISQLGFILGGTAGLITGVLVSALAQGAVALIKFANENVGSEDRVRALNDALSRQKSLVEELAQAYESLADSIAQSALSGVAQRREEIRRQVDDIRSRQNDQARERIVGLDPEVQRQRGVQAARQRELEQSEDPARRVLLQAQIEEARRREQQAAEAAIARPALPPLDAARRAIEARRRVEEAALPANEGDLGAAERENRVRIAAEQRLAEIEAQFAGAGSEQERFNLARNQIREEQGRLRALAEQRGVFGEPTDASLEAERQLLELSQALADLERDFTASTNAAAASAAEAAIRTGDVLGEAQQRIAAVFGESGSQIGAQADLLGSRLEQLAREIEAAQIAGDSDRINAAQAEIEAIRKQADALNIATQSLKRFAESLDSAVGQIVEAAAGDARNAADQARRGANLLGGQESRGLAQRRDVEFAKRQRDRARTEAQGIGLRAAGLRAEQAALRGRFVQNAAAGLLGPEVQGLVGERERARSVLDDRNAAPNAKIEAEAALELVNQRLQAAFESLPEVQRLAGLADNLDAATQATIAFAEAIAEGRRLVLTDAQRAADDFIVQVQKINAALAAGEINQGQRDAAIARIRQDGLRQLAPTVFGLADQVANAVLQGPSRAALNATDVSTVEGSRELNRLLRGEDSARDQPLIELQREANKIAERIARGVENNEAKLAN